MTDILIQKLEEKITILLAELEDLRFEVQQLKQENSDFKTDKLNYVQKLQELIFLLDSADDTADISSSYRVGAHEREAMQGPEEFTLP
jgi:regulator of replication initiation timing